MQDKEIQLIFNPAGGSVNLKAVTALRGDRIGALPQAVRRGYTFEGWYTSPAGEANSGLHVTSETVADDRFADETVLYARWASVNKADQRKKKKSSLGTQKKALVAMIVAVAILIAALGVVKYIVDIYHYTDTDGVEYTIKKKDGVYGLYYDGRLCDVNDEGYYLTRFGNQLSLDPETGEYEIYAVVDVEGTEEVGASQRVLMFKQLTYDQSSTSDASRVLKRIEVHNQHGVMTFVRGDNNRFFIEGHEGTLFSEQLFAQLSVGCGYTISMQRLENPVRLSDGSIDLSEYGLAPEERTRTDEEGNEETYDYVPSYYTLTTMTNETYTVTLGDATVSGAGYYAMYEDRQTVYILSSSNLDAAVLQPVETLVTPMMVYPMSMNSYFNVENFTYRSDIDYDGIFRDMVLELTGLDLSEVETDPETGEYPDEIADKIKESSEKMDAMEEEELSKLYDKLYKNNSKLVTAFSYVDMDERLNTLFSAIPYQMATEYMTGYFPNSDNISAVLQALYQTTFNSVIKLGPKDEDFEKYGLDQPAHTLSFLYRDAEGQEYSNYVEISAKTEDGTYYAYSDNFDMIVSVPESSLPFLEWEEIDWYEREYFQANIAYIDRIVLEAPSLETPIVFDLDNSASDQSEGVNSEALVVYANGELMDYSLVVTKPSGSQTTETAVYNFRRFIQAMLTASMEGVAELSEEEMEALRSSSDENCQLKLTVLMDDKQGNTKYAVYRFYQYTERKSYMTLEILDSPNATPDPTRGQGTFYVLRTFCDKLIADAQRFIAGQEIDVDSKN